MCTLSGRARSSGPPRLKGKRVLTIGSKEYPHRWVGGEDNWPSKSTPMWDWDGTKRAWVTGFEPFTPN